MKVYVYGGNQHPWGVIDDFEEAVRELMGTVTLPLTEDISEKNPERIQWEVWFIDSTANNGDADMRWTATVGGVPLFIESFVLESRDSES